MNKKIIIYVLSLLLCSYIASAALIDGQISYWKSDTNGTFPDAVGTLPNGVINSATFTNDGIINGAYDYDGSSNNINIVDSGANISFGDGNTDSPFSVSVWINMDATNGFDIISKGKLSNRQWRIGTRGTSVLTFILYDYDGGSYNGEIGIDASSLSSYANKWLHIVATYDGSDANTGMKLYVNNSVEATTPISVGTYDSMDTSTENVTIAQFFTDGPENADGIIDEIGIWNKELNTTEINQLFNSGNGSQYPYSVINVTNVSITLDYPVNETHYHLVGTDPTKVFNGSILMTTNVDTNCTLNNSNWNLVTSNSTDHSFINNTALADANYSILANCSSGNVSNSMEFWFIIDTIDPNIDLYSPANNSVQYNNMTLSVVYSDLYLYRTNTTIIRESDNVTVYNNFSGDLTGLNIYYNLTETINLNNGSYPIGKFRILYEVVDTHTKKDFKENPPLITNIVNNKYKSTLNLKKGKFTIEHDLDLEIKTKKEKDRIKFKHKKDKLERTDIFIEGDKLVYLKDSYYPCHFIVNDNYWYDCVGYSNPEVTMINETYYKIEFDMDKKEVISESLGGLNYVNKTSFFYKVNITFNNVSVGDTFSPPDANFTYISTQNFNITSLIVNNTCVIISGSLSYDNDYCYDLHELFLEDVVAFVNMTPVKCFANLSNIMGFTIPTVGKWFNKNNTLIQTGTSTDCEHNQICTIDTLNNTLIEFNNSYSCKANITTAWFTSESDASDSINSDSIGVCQAPNIYPIGNISYFDEVDFTNINATNSYQVIFTDGLGTFSLEGNFSLDYYHQFCTSVDPTNTTVNLNMWGDFTLKKSGYSTRVLNYIQTNAFLLSNNPTTNISFFLIKLNESSVIEYTWRTTSFQFIDGTMLIYRCNDDNTQTLLSSQPVANGFASANLQLFTVPYSYQINIDGTTFTDATFSTCHVENVQNRDFFVDVDLVDILPAIGLFLVDCKMTKTSNTTARMTWTANPQDTSEIYGCMIGRQTTVFGEEEVFRNCTNSSVGDFTRTVPNLGASVTVIGEITQNSNKGYCQQTLHYYTETDSYLGIIGLSGLLASLIIILIMTYLLYNESGTLALTGVVLGYVFAFILGMLVIEWQTILMIIFMAIGIALVGRYTKKGPFG